MRSGSARRLLQSRRIRRCACTACSVSRPAASGRRPGRAGAAPPRRCVAAGGGGQHQPGRAAAASSASCALSTSRRPSIAITSASACSTACSAATPSGRPGEHRPRSDARPAASPQAFAQRRWLALRAVEPGSARPAAWWVPGQRTDPQDQAAARTLQQRPGAHGPGALRPRASNTARRPVGADDDVFHAAVGRQRGHPQLDAVLRGINPRKGQPATAAGDARPRQLGQRRAPSARCASVRAARCAAPCGRHGAATPTSCPRSDGSPRCGWRWRPCPHRIGHPRDQRLLHRIVRRPPRWPPPREFTRRSGRCRPMRASTGRRHRGGAARQWRPACRPLPDRPAPAGRHKARSIAAFRSPAPAAPARYQPARARRAARGTAWRDITIATTSRPARCRSGNTSSAGRLQRQPRRGTSFCGWKFVRLTTG